MAAAFLFPVPSPYFLCKVFDRLRLVPRPPGVPARDGWLSLRQALALCLAIPVAACTFAEAQSSPAEVLEQRALMLDGQGRHDLAAENWRQLLSVSPKNPQALAALARFCKGAGDTATAEVYLRELRQVSPGAADKRGMPLMATEAGDGNALAEAARMAAGHKYTESLALYRRAFHGTPPPGGWALAYYETEAAVPGEQGQAVTGPRGLVKVFPGRSDVCAGAGKGADLQTGDPVGGSAVAADGEGVAGADERGAGCVAAGHRVGSGGAGGAGDGGGLSAAVPGWSIVGGAAGGAGKAAAAGAGARRRGAGCGV